MQCVFYAAGAYRYRQDLKLWQLSYEPVYVDGFVFAFSRGSAALVVLSGYAAKQHPEELPRTVALTNLPEGMRGTTLYNIFDPNVRICALESAYTGSRLSKM